MKQCFRVVPLLLLLFIPRMYAQEENRAFVRKGVKWPTNAVRVSWVNPDNSNRMQRQLVQNAIRDTWEKESALKFIWCNNDENTDGIHILIKDAWPHTKGLGKQLAESEAGMVLNFDFREWKPIENGTYEQVMNRYEYYVRVIAVHEFGHALGFEHEQKRDDCPNCDDSEQSTQVSRQPGDWWTSTCDARSVMNYCNENYNNNGILSEDDIEGVRALYGPPVDISPSSNSFTARLVHSVKNNDDGGAAVKVYLTGDNAEMENVNRVIYKMDKRFDPDVIVSEDPANNYSLQINLTSAMDFTLDAVVEYRDGTKNSIQRYINFNPGIAGRVELNQVKIDFEKTDLANNRFLFGFSIDRSSSIFNKVVRVEYTRDHPTFSVKTLTGDNPDNNFKVEWNGWGCIPIQIRVYYTENNQLFYKKLVYDMCKALGWQ